MNILKLLLANITYFVVGKVTFKNNFFFFFVQRVDIQKKLVKMNKYMILKTQI